MVEIKNSSEIQLLKDIVSSLPENCVIIEIGSWKGKSTNILADALRDNKKKGIIYAIDPHQGHTGWIKSHPETFMEFMENTKRNREYIAPMRMTSSDASCEWRPQTVDFIFIDGDHSYEGVYNDITSWIINLKPNGLMALHDSLTRSVWKAIKEVLIKGNHSEFVDLKQSLSLFRKHIDTHTNLYIYQKRNRRLELRRLINVIKKKIWELSIQWRKN